MRNVWNTGLESDQAATCGLHGRSDAPGDSGVFGDASASSGGAYHGHGKSNSRALLNHNDDAPVLCASGSGMADLDLASGTATDDDGTLLGCIRACTALQVSHIIVQTIDIGART